jgi:hypothetical protein
MTETRRTNHKAKVPEFLREPLEMAQARLGVFEDEAQRIWKDLMEMSKTGRRELGVLVERLQKQMERAQWRDKAESFRADALEKLVELQSKAVGFLGVATREQVEELSREIEKVLRRLEGKGTRAGHVKRGHPAPGA